MWAERNRVRPRRDEEPKPSRWWRSRWSVALPASKARNRFLGLGFGGRPQRGGQQPARISPSQSPARQSGNERWLARVPGAGAARFSAYRHALARRSGGRSSTLSLGAYYPVQPEALPAGHAPQSRTATPPTLRGRIQLPAQPPHYGDQSISPTRAGLSHNQHYHLQGVDHRAGSSLIFIYAYLYYATLVAPTAQIRGRCYTATRYKRIGQATSALARFSRKWRRYYQEVAFNSLIVWMWARRFVRSRNR